MKEENPDKRAETEEHDEQTSSRRKVIKSAVAGSVAATVLAPTKWTKPVVDTVLIPAHAVTSEVAADSGDTDEPEPEPEPDPVVPRMRTFFGQVDLVIQNSPLAPQNNVQVASVDDEKSLLDALRTGVSDLLVPEAEAQIGNPSYSLCVEDNDGSLTVTLQQIFERPSGVVHFTGAGGFGSAIVLSTTCEEPGFFEGSFFSPIEVELTDSSDTMIGYSFLGQSGMLPEAGCALAGQSCPVFEFNKDIQEN